MIKKSCPPVKDPVIHKSADDYKQPKQRVIAILGSANKNVAKMYGAQMSILISKLNKKNIALLLPGCEGIMGAATKDFCDEGLCTAYAAQTWYQPYTPNAPTCASDCEKDFGVNMHIVENVGIEESILTGGGTGGKGDAFLIMPGGVGTSRELFDILQANYEFGNVNKPIFCYNLRDNNGNGWWDGIIGWINHLIRKGTLSRKYPNSLGSSFYYSSNINALSKVINTWGKTGKLPKINPYGSLKNLDPPRKTNITVVVVLLGSALAAVIFLFILRVKRGIM